jgi:hypothetical protein
MFLFNERDESLGFAVIEAPVVHTEHLAALVAVRQTHPLIGFTHYRTFPGPAERVDSIDYLSLCAGWCHCFQRPDEYIPAPAPKLLISGSDFTDPDTISATSLELAPLSAKEYDFIYICPDGAWAEENKNWSLAKKCIPILCDQLGLRGLLVGRKEIPDLPPCKGLNVIGWVPWPVILLLLHRSRFLFVPNVLDASPRVITQALCMNIPILVNRAILGGWKYVNSYTGAFFGDEEDVAAGACQCLVDGLLPRQWYADNYGPYRSSQRLHAFLRSLDPKIPDARLIRFVESTV